MTKFEASWNRGMFKSQFAKQPIQLLKYLYVVFKFYIRLDRIGFNVNSICSYPASLIIAISYY